MLNATLTGIEIDMPVLSPKITSSQYDREIIDLNALETVSVMVALKLVIDKIVQLDNAYKLGMSDEQFALMDDLIIYWRTSQQSYFTKDNIQFLLDIANGKYTER